MKKILKFVGIFLLFLVSGVLGAIFFAPSNIEYHTLTIVEAPASEVWTTMMDESQMHKWSDGYKSTKILSGKVGEVGQVSEVTMEQDDRTDKKIETIETIIENRQYSFRGEKADLMSFKTDVFLEAKDSLTTFIRTDNSIEAIHPMFKLFLYNEEAIADNSSANYMRLKKLVENK